MAAVIVIDVGSATHGGDESFSDLVEAFKPDMYIGIDPADTREQTESVQVLQAAAWTYDGEIGFSVGGLGGHVDRSSAQMFPCVDLARIIHDLDGEIVLKMDAEGAEYTILPHLAETDADLLLKVAFIEWHCEKCGLGGNGRHRDNCTMNEQWWWERRNKVEEMLRCPVEEWNR